MHEVVWQQPAEGQGKLYTQRVDGPVLTKWTAGAYMLDDALKVLTPALLTRSQGAPGLRPRVKLDEDLVLKVVQEPSAFDGIVWEGSQ